MKKVVFDGYIPVGFVDENLLMEELMVLDAKKYFIPTEAGIYGVFSLETAKHYFISVFGDKVDVSRAVIKNGCFIQTGEYQTLDRMELIEYTKQLDNQIIEAEYIMNEAVYEQCMANLDEILELDLIEDLI